MKVQRWVVMGAISLGYPCWPVRVLRMIRAILLVFVPVCRASHPSIDAFSRGGHVERRP